MISRLLLGGALLTAAAVVAACHPAKLGEGRDRNDRPLRVNARLDCPERQGELRRADAAADGRSCRYTGPDGQEVTLSYLALAGRSAQDALAPMEADFRTQVPGAAAPEPGSLNRREPSAGVDGVDSDDGGKDEAKDADDGEARRVMPTPSDAPLPPKPPEPPRVDRGWAASEAHRSERVTVNLPFLHVDADGNGRAHVTSPFGVVDADDRGAVIQGRWNGSKAEINAHDGGTEMRFGAVGEHRADLTYIVASDTAGPQGWRAAGYVAKGPVEGPLVVASARGREKMHGRHDQELGDLKRLVDRNVRPDRR